MGHTLAHSMGHKCVLSGMWSLPFGLIPSDPCRLHMWPTHGDGPQCFPIGACPQTPPPGSHGPANSVFIIFYLPFYYFCFVSFLRLFLFYWS